MLPPRGIIVIVLGTIIINKLTLSIHTSLFSNQQAYPVLAFPAPHKKSLGLSIYLFPPFIYLVRTLLN